MNESCDEITFNRKIDVVVLRWLGITNIPSKKARVEPCTGVSVRCLEVNPDWGALRRILRRWQIPPLVAIDSFNHMGFD